MPDKDPAHKREWELRHRQQGIAHRREMRRIEVAWKTAPRNAHGPKQLSGPSMNSGCRCGRSSLLQSQARDRRWRPDAAWGCYFQERLDLVVNGRADFGRRAAVSMER